MISPALCVLGKILGKKRLTIIEICKMIVLTGFNKC